MALADTLLPWVVGAAVLVIAVPTIDHYVARSRAAAFCDDLAPGTERDRVNEVMSRLSERSGVVKVIDRRDYVSVVFSGPFVKTVQCVVRLDSGKTATVQVSDKYKYQLSEPVKTIGIRE